jgi:C1A family cysteine protease
MSWITKGAVTPIRDQGSCGSCWAFGAVAGAESTLILKGEADLTVDLSEQYLTECTPESGCDGTYDVNKVMIVTKSGLPTEA